MFIDSHAHLDGKQFAADRGEVIARARGAGVETIVAIGNGDGPANVDVGIQLADAFASGSVDLPVPAGDVVGKTVRESAGVGAQLFRKTPVPRIYATLGVHPHEARLVDEAAYENMTRLAKHPKVIAWGEIGLDYFYDHSPRDIQRQVFIRQMELAQAAKLPIVIHCRPSDNSEDAWEDCLRLIRERWASNGLGGILHCFTGTWNHAKQALDMGFMISFAGNVTFPKAQQIRDAAKEVPLERMLIETDCPYLAPVPYRGKRNEPAYVKETARQLGELRGLSTDEIGERTSANFYDFFKLAKAGETRG